MGRCANCGMEILAGTNFCRACGASVASESEQSEMQTAMLEDKVSRTATQRFEPRKTAEASTEVPLSTYNPERPGFSAGPAQAPARSRRSLLVVGMIVLVLLGGATLLSVMKRLRHSSMQTQVSSQFNYPGAQTIVNVGGERGAVLQMETADRLEKVSAWYEATLKPTKTLRVTSDTIIMNNNNITVTMAGTVQGTSIAIKQSAP